MHMIIRAIVYAEDKQDALAKASEVFERLTHDQRPFDYYQMFDTEGTSVSGKGRWGNLPDAVKVDSKEGKKLIEEGMKYTKESFMQAIKNIREAVEKYSDEELFEDEKVETEEMKGMFKYFCYVAGGYEGPDIFLYNNDGDGIRSQSDLDSALNKWKTLYEQQGRENPYEDLDVWVVPADVHY